MPLIDVSKDVYHDDGTKAFDFASVSGNDHLASGTLSPPLSESRGVRGSIGRASESIRTAVQAVKGRIRKGETRSSTFYVPPPPQSSEQAKQASSTDPPDEDLRSPPSIVVTDPGSIADGRQSTKSSQSGRDGWQSGGHSSGPGTVQDSEALARYHPNGSAGVGNLESNGHVGGKSTLLFSTPPLPTQTFLPLCSVRITCGQSIICTEVS